MIVDGTDDEIRRAGAILSNRGIQDWGIYDAHIDTTTTSTVTTTRPDYLVFLIVNLELLSSIVEMRLYRLF